MIKDDRFAGFTEIYGIAYRWKYQDRIRMEAGNAGSVHSEVT
jgi:hypothetical protein